MTTLVIVPCGKAKIWDKRPDVGPTPACDAYTGTPFCLNRKYAERFGDEWVILSAKYGFVWHDQSIQNYDVSFTHPNGEEVEHWTLLQQARAMRMFDFSKIIGLGGKEYRSKIENVFSCQTIIDLQFPFSGLTIGKTMKAIKDLLDHSYSHALEG